MINFISRITVKIIAIAIPVIAMIIIAQADLALIVWVVVLDRVTHVAVIE